MTHVTPFPQAGWARHSENWKKPFRKAKSFVVEIRKKRPTARQLAVLKQRFKKT